jgi:hypothetical protein
MLDDHRFIPDSRLIALALFYNGFDPYRGVAMTKLSVRLSARPTPGMANMPKTINYSTLLPKRSFPQLANLRIPFGRIERIEAGAWIETHLSKFGLATNFIEINTDEWKVFGQYLSGLNHTIQ